MIGYVNSIERKIANTIEDSTAQSDTESNSHSRGNSDHEKFKDLVMKTQSLDRIHS